MAIKNTYCFPKTCIHYATLWKIYGPKEMCCTILKTKAGTRLYFFPVNCISGSFTEETRKAEKKQERNQGEVRLNELALVHWLEL